MKRAPAAFLALVIVAAFAAASLANRVSLQEFTTTGTTGECFLRDVDAGTGGSWDTCPGGGSVSDGDKGDIVVTDGGVTWKIDDPTDDRALVANGTGWDRKALPDCDDSGGNHLNYDTGTNAFSCGTSGDASGASGDAPTVTFARQSASFSTTSTTPSDVSGMGVSLTSGHLYHFNIRFAAKGEVSSVALWWNLTHPTVTDGLIIYNAGSPVSASNGASSEWRCHNGSGTTSPTSSCNPTGMGGTDDRWYYYTIDGAIKPSADGTLQLQGSIETITGARTVYIDYGYIELLDFGT